MGDLTINNIDNLDTFRNHELVAGWLKCVESFMNQSGVSMVAGMVV